MRLIDFYKIGQINFMGNKKIILILECNKNNIHGLVFLSVSPAFAGL